MKPCGRAALRSGSSQLFSTIPRRSCLETFLKSTLAGGVWQRLLRSRVRLPSGARAPVAQWVEQRATFRSHLFPGRIIFLALLEWHATTTTLAGGVGRGYFSSRSARVRIPPGAQALVAQWQSVGKIPQPLVPRPELFSGGARTRRAKASTLAGGVGNGYFSSRSARVRIPPGAQALVAQWQSVGKIPQPLVPRPETSGRSG